ncbi:hypothetical protein D5086_020650 [Populus alba]|uniref:Uncharacterized protein n=1 Tax=Populus alba TaxID=43335 RepID=A0ACC4BL94_POPAL
MQELDVKMTRKQPCEVEERCIRNLLIHWQHQNKAMPVNLEGYRTRLIEDFHRKGKSRRAVVGGRWDPDTRIYRSTYYGVH